MKRSWILLLALLLLACESAFAQIYEGSTVALSSVSVESECEGVLETLCVQAGQSVAEGETIGKLKATSVFSAEDGTVANVEAKEGEKLSGEVLSIRPQSLYLIYCSTSSAYKSPENVFIHSGETLYVKCTKDGSHRALGIVTQVDGKEYQLETTGGALYIGETVYLYRSSGFESSTRVGIGTVVSSSTVSYSAEGVISEMKVSVGDSVEKGQILFRYYPEGDGNITAGTSGIVSKVTANQGDSLQKGTVLAEIVPLDEIGIEIIVDEAKAACLKKGEQYRYTLANDRESTPHLATVTAVYAIADGEGYRVLLKPEETPGYLGLSAEVQIEY